MKRSDLRGRLRLVVLSVWLLAGTRPAVAMEDAPANEIRLDTGVASPSGSLGVRYGHRFGEGPWLSGAVGLGYTGLILSALVDQPLFEYRHEIGRSNGSFFAESLDVSLGLYLGYAAGLASDGLGDPLDHGNEPPPPGIYHWANAGLLLRFGLGPLVVTGGLGLSALLDAPDLSALPSDRMYYILPQPEGWVRGGLAPSLFTAVGWRF